MVRSPILLRSQRWRSVPRSAGARAGRGLVGWAGTALGLVGLGALVTKAPSLTAAIALASVGTVICAIAPVDFLPIAAVLVSVVTPVQVIKLALGGIPFALWLFRADVRRPGALTRALAAAAAAWSLAAMATAPLHKISGITWEGAFLLAIIAPLVWSMPVVSNRVRRTYVTTVAIIAAYGIVEKWILHSNPLYGHLLASDPRNAVLQIWSSYRATTVIGQPLIDATIFGPALILALDDYLSADGDRRWVLMRALLLVGGLVATVSRGPTIAVALGVVLLIGIRRSRGRRHAWRRFALTGAAAIAATIAVPLLVARGTSTEGAGSLSQRSFLVQDTELALSHSYLLGVGPGQAESYREAQMLPRSGTALESALAQVLVEIGIPGLLLLVAAMASVVLPALRRAESAGAAIAVLVMLAALGTYDSLESRQNLMLILGFLLCMTGPRASARASSGKQGLV